MQHAKKVALIGLDSAITSLVRKHIDEGLLPNLKKLMDTGTVAENCSCAYPTITPPNWTTMATGAWPGTHGITDFWLHIPGTSPQGANTHNAFNWDKVQAESIWEAADKIGKKSIVLNFPSSYNVHKKLKHGTVIGGASVIPMNFTDQTVIAELTNTPYNGDVATQVAIADDVLFSTAPFPGPNVKVKFVPAKGWKNIDEEGDDPLDFTFDMLFANSIAKTGTATWHLLLRDIGGNGYDTVSICTSKDFKDALFTVKVGDWSEPFNYSLPMADGTTRLARSRAKFLSIDDQAEDFRLYFSHSTNLDGEFWCYPPEQAKKLNKGNNIVTTGGTVYLGYGWFGFETWVEIIENHYDWLGDTAEALLANPADWDIFFSHAHPTDFMYHLIMTEMDETTCASKKSYDEAWSIHRRIYQAADRYVGRLLKAFGPDTLIAAVGDHGATPDGPNIDLVDVLSQAGLCVRTPFDIPEWAKACPDNVKETFKNLSASFDLEKTLAIPQRMCYVYVNLKGRDPGGCVEPEDYAKVQRQIVEALMAYVHPESGKHPFMLALPKEEAAILGLWGDAIGDVVYALWPEFSMQHGPILPSSSYGIGTLHTLCIYNGPNVKKGYSMDRHCNLVDLVPTFCYGTGLPVPKDCEGSVVYQIFE